MCRGTTSQTQMSGICSYPWYDERGEPAEQRAVHGECVVEGGDFGFGGGSSGGRGGGERYSAGGVEFEKDKNQALAAEEAEK